MKDFFLRSWLGPGLLALGLGWGPVPMKAAPLQAGMASVEITPPVGWRMSGYFFERRSTGTHDPLQARALVLQQGQVKAGLVSCDLISISRDLSTRTRQLAARRTGIPEEHILVAATHTHTGPLYAGFLRDHWHQNALAKEGRDPFESVDYPAILVERLADAFTRAHRHLQPVHVEAGAAEQTGLSFQRRFRMKDGSVTTNPGKNNPNIVRPAGPIDPQVGFLVFLNAARNRALASFTSFALHLDTVGGTEYSADYPSYLERSLREALGADLISLFGLGACGDINHIDVTDARPQKGHAEAGRIGTNLAATVVQLFPKLAPLKRPSLAVRRAVVSLPLQPVRSEEVAQARLDLAKVGTKELPFLAQVRACTVLDLERRGPDPLACEVQVFRLSADTALVGLPGEVFVELGLAIKKGSPFPNTWVLELCNDSIAYVPTRQAFAEGGYEVTNSRIAAGGGEQLVETALRLLRELKP